MLQLNPMVPMVTDDGRNCTAFLTIDYSQEHDLLFVCFMDDTREIWTFPNGRLRVRENITMGRESHGSQDADASP